MLPWRMTTNSLLQTTRVYTEAEFPEIGQLFRADDDGTAAAVFGQMVGEYMARMGGLDGTVEQLAQQGLRVEGHLKLLV